MAYGAGLYQPEPNNVIVRIYQSSKITADEHSRLSQFRLDIEECFSQAGIAATQQQCLYLYNLATNHPTALSGVIQGQCCFSHRETAKEDSASSKEKLIKLFSPQHS